MSYTTAQRSGALQTLARAEASQFGQAAADQVQSRQQVPGRHRRQKERHAHTMEGQEKLRRLATVDEDFVEGEAVVALSPASASTLDVRTTALVQLGALAAIGSAAAGLKWGVSRALAWGATEEEVADVLLAVAPVTGLGRAASAALQVAAALGYDITAAKEDRNDI